MATTLIRYSLRETPNQRASFVTQLETAQLFGWDDAFPRWGLVRQQDLDGNEFVYFHPTGRANGTWRGGHRLRICRVKRKTGYPGGFTHCFRMKGSWRKSDLVRLAQIAGAKFEWMENKQRARIDRDIWLAS